MECDAEDLRVRGWRVDGPSENPGGYKRFLRSARFVPKSIKIHPRTALRSPALRRAIHNSRSSLPRSKLQTSSALNPQLPDTMAAMRTVMMLLAALVAILAMAAAPAQAGAHHPLLFLTTL